MNNENIRVLVLNPGSTSTKFGVYARDGAELVRTIRHGQEELAAFSGQPIQAQLDYRAQLVEQALAAAGYAVGGFAAVAGRGGFLPPAACGTYLVDDAMVEELRQARRGEHASNLGAP
ncbi:MAG: butyrate kinase, partial [Terracidiphilus sp.]